MPPDHKTLVIDTPDAVDGILNTLSKELVGARPHHLVATVSVSSQGWTFTLTCPSSENWERYLFIDVAVHPVEGLLRVEQFLLPYLKDGSALEDRS